MIDPSAYFFMILGFLAIRLDLPLLLMSAAAIGAFAKETTFALIFAALLAPMNSRRKLLKAGSLIPSIVIYALVRCMIPPSAGGGVLEAWYKPTFLDYIRSLFIPDRTLDLLSSFGVLWLFAALSLFSSEVPIILKRWSWFILVVLGTMIVADLNLRERASVDVSGRNPPGAVWD